MGIFDFLFRRRSDPSDISQSIPIWRKRSNVVRFNSRLKEIEKEFNEMWRSLEKLEEMLPVVANHIAELDVDAEEYLAQPGKGEEVRRDIKFTSQLIDRVQQIPLTVDLLVYRVQEFRKDIKSGLERELPRLRRFQKKMEQYWSHPLIYRKGKSRSLRRPQQPSSRGKRSQAGLAAK